MAAPAIMSPKDGPEGQIGIALPLHEKPAVVAFYRVLTALSAWLLVGVLVFKPNAKIIGYPLTMYFCIGIIIFCAKVRGAKVFGRTPVDVAFVIWLGLAVLSQLWASMVLNRVLQADDITQYLTIIITTWLAFRVAFALCCVDPRTATGAFLKAILVCLGIACLIGILQGYGPGPLKHWAIDFGVNNGTKGDVTALQVEMTDSPRPVALFSGPNYFGFMNLIGMCIIIGITIAQGKAISSKNVWTAAAGLTLFLIGTVVAQSRFAILTALLLIFLFMYLMFRIGQTKVVITGGLALGAVLLAGVIFLGQMNLTYLEGTFQRKVQDDYSYQERMIGFDALKDQAIDLAPLGSGFDSHGFILDRSRGDVWSRTNSIDNGYLQAFINHGIPGVIQLLFFLWSLWWGIKLAGRHNYLHIRTLRVVAGLLLATYMVYSLSGVRHAKLETGIYWMFVFGLLYGSIYGEKYFGDKAWFRRKRVLPQPAAAP
jgi:hypothetical protein